MENETMTQPPENRLGQPDSDWDTDNVRLGIFLILFAIWTPFQFVPLVGDTLCKGKEELYYFTFPLMCLALFLSRRRPQKAILRLYIFAIFALLITLIRLWDKKNLEDCMLLVLPCIYFAAERTHREHAKNVIIMLITIDIAALYRYLDWGIYDTAVAATLIYLPFKYKFGLARPILFLLMLTTAHKGWVHQQCPGKAARWQCGRAESDLKNLAIAEEAYITDHGVYPNRLRDFTENGSVKPGRRVSIIITHADHESFRLRAFHPFCDRNGDGAPDFYYWDSANGGLQYP